MKFRKTLSAVLLIAAAVAALSSCKKKEDDTKYFNGTVVVHGGKPIIEPGETLTFTADGLLDTEGLELIYKWSVTDRDKIDTSYLAKGEWTYTFPKDGLKSYTVSCSISATGYYSSVGKSIMTIVKDGPEGSIPEIYDPENHNIVVDEDGFEYAYVKIGKLLWTTRNLGTRKAGVSYMESPAMDNIVGKYYNYEEALTICPEGWRLPTDAEWMSAIQASATETPEEYKTWKGVCGSVMTYAKFNGTDLWDFWPEVDVTNETGLMVIPVGYANTESKINEGFSEQAVFWTADANSEEKAYCRYIVESNPDMYSLAAHKTSFGASVRCVKDAE